MKDERLLEDFTNDQIADLAGDIGRRIGVGFDRAPIVRDVFAKEIDRSGEWFALVPSTWNAAKYGDVHLYVPVTVEMLRTRYPLDENGEVMEADDEDESDYADASDCPHYEHADRDACRVCANCCPNIHPCNECDYEHA